MALQELLAGNGIARMCRVVNARQRDLKFIPQTTGTLWGVFRNSVHQGRDH